jgi:D-amino-acid dehydrogenase
MSRVVVVGAGVVGVATAYVLCRQGREVTLVDRLPEAGRGASAANGAQLSYAFGDALASPAFLAHMPAVLLGRDPAYRVRLQADPEFLVWGLRFLWNARASAFAANTRAILELARESAEVLAELLAEIPLSFDHAPSGKMILYRDAAACAAGEGLRAMKRGLGFRQEVLSRDEATAVEPALADHPDPVARVLWSPDDAAGAPDRFCRDLAAALRDRHGLRTRFGAEVIGLIRDGGRVVGVALADGEPLACDQVVIATGAAADLLPRADRGVGAIWPVQGYSLTAPATNRAMRVSITDLSRKMVFARLGDRVRVAGMADIGPRRVRFDPRRFEAFRRGAVEAFGPAFDHGADLSPWSGGRPCTPSSRPMLGPSRIPGLFLNLGHGTLGWTLCLGAARRLGAMMAGAP